MLVVAIVAPVLVLILSHWVWGRLSIRRLAEVDRLAITRTSRKGRDATVVQWVGYRLEAGGRIAPQLSIEFSSRMGPGGKAPCIEMDGSICEVPAYFHGELINR